MPSRPRYSVPAGAFATTEPFSKGNRRNVPSGAAGIGGLIVRLICLADLRWCPDGDVRLPPL
jgi:hypothetical protein